MVGLTWLMQHLQYGEKASLPNNCRFNELVHCFDPAMVP
ncbi:hypothetical protein SAMCCGM7_pA0014 (plasmid) [Sinorhizobium americanum CCGM7]|nr:hypothetical protein SAMCCGM7_pA0014 [Sinorhizobium americanum CCGM7]